MTALGIHTVDTFHYLAGPAKRVVAFSKQIMGKHEARRGDIRPHRVRARPRRVDHHVLLRPAVVSLGVYGTDGNAWNEDDGASLFVQRAGEVGRTQLDVATPRHGGGRAGGVRALRRAAVTKPETGAAEALEVAAVLEAIIESAASGRAVELADIR